MKKLIGNFAFFMMLFGALLISHNAEAQGKAKISKAKGFIIFSNVKMSSSDQRGLLSLLKSNSSSYKLAVAGSSGVRSYGRLSSSKVKSSIQAAGIKGATATTCTEVSTSNECYKVNTTIEEKALSGQAREQINSLLAKYMR